jgi:hypothetical protein
MRFTPRSVETKDDRIETVYLFTREEAIDFVKQRGFAIYAHINVDMPVENDPDHFFPGRTSLQLTHKEAIRFVGNALSEVLERRGARMRFTFIEYTSYSKSKSLWIG